MFVLALFGSTALMAQYATHATDVKVVTKSSARLAAPGAATDAAVGTASPLPASVSSRGSRYSSIGTTIGTTFYDLQSNSSMQRRIIHYSGGTVAATFTLSTSPDGMTGAFADRGSGYNFYDGLAWGTAPTIRIEGSTRTGWPALSTIGNHEYIMAHSTAVYQGYHSANSVSGSTTFTSNAVTLGVTAIWPKMATSGNHIYILTCNQDTLTPDPVSGVRNSIYYSQSDDGGNTWIHQGDSIPGYNSSRYYRSGADDYFIDARDSIVAFVIGGLGKDLTLWKSTNYGATYTKTVIQAFPMARWDYGVQTDFAPQDGVTDTAETNDGTVTCSIDHSGTVHVWYGYALLFCDGPSATYLPFVGALMYWNESMGTPTEITALSDYLCNGETQFNLGTGYSTGTANSGDARYRASSLINMPQASIGADDNLYVVYSVVEPDDTTDLTTSSALLGQNYRDLFMIYSSDHGATWSKVYDITNSYHWEDAFPTIAADADSHVYMTWQEDEEPGTVLGNGDAQYSGNAIKYMSLSIDTIKAHCDAGDRICQTVSTGTGIADISTLNHINVFPNPATNSATLMLNTSEAQHVSVQVLNVLGESVLTRQLNLHGGVNTMSLDCASLSNGVYFVSVNLNGETQTTKLTVAH